jgi:hypothetical protein
MASLLAAALFFDGIHFLIFGTALRAKIVGLIGERKGRVFCGPALYDALPFTSPAEIWH